MRLVTFDSDRIGLVDGDDVIDVTDSVPIEPAGVSSMRRLISAPGSPVAELPTDGTRRPLSSVRLRAPMPDPTKVVAAPVNYRDHMNEMSSATNISSMGMFLKAPSSVIGPDAAIELPYDDRRFDQEGELAVVVGRRARQVTEADALDHVFGYTGLFDITMRGGEDRSLRKSFDTFTPTGPWIVTADELGPPDDVALSCWVNGVLRQSATTADLIWSVAKLVSYASWVMTLEPGDIIATGTPSGVGPLEDGDELELELGGLGGRLCARVVSGRLRNSPTLGATSGPIPPPPGPGYAVRSARGSGPPRVT